MVTNAAWELRHQPTSCPCRISEAWAAISWCLSHLLLPSSVALATPEWRWFPPQFLATGENLGTCAAAVQLRWWRSTLRTRLAPLHRRCRLCLVALFVHAGRCFGQKRFLERRCKWELLKTAQVGTAALRLCICACRCEG